MNKQLPILQSICCAPGAPPLDAESARAIAATFKALADPTRVAIVNQLACCDECCVCDLTATFDLSQPTISHHLRILRDAGLVESESRGTWAYYRLVPDALVQLRDVLAP
jgi:ArsR family transcriptional regulator, arsenate/arsenite/antimonite-responsive transcriptional repressor